MRSGTWDVRILYRGGSLMKDVKELSKCKSDLVGVQEVRWDRGGTKAGTKYTFFYRKGNENHELCIGFHVHERIISVIMRTEFVSDKMSYVIQRGQWCNIIVISVHAPTEDINDDVKHSFQEE
jgi:hypothetical protein